MATIHGKPGSERIGRYLRYQRDNADDRAGGAAEPGRIPGLPARQWPPDNSALQHRLEIALRTPDRIGGRGYGEVWHLKPYRTLTEALRAFLSAPAFADDVAEVDSCHGYP